MHYHRLETDCNTLGIVCPSADILRDDIERLVGVDESCVIKIIVTRGESVRSYAVRHWHSLRAWCLKLLCRNIPTAIFRKACLCICVIRGWPGSPRLAGIKHLNRLENVLARMEWTDHQIVDGLMMDEGGNVIECTSRQLVRPIRRSFGDAGSIRERGGRSDAGSA